MDSCLRRNDAEQTKPLNGKGFSDNSETYSLATANAEARISSVAILGELWVSTVFKKFLILSY